MKTRKTFVGFGFGPIQGGLFLFEAYMSGNFSRFVLTEIDPDLVKAVRSHKGCYAVNIARRECIENFELKGIEIYNPLDPSDRDVIIDAVSESDEMSTALPSVDYYDAGHETSVASTIGKGLSKRTRSMLTIIYAAENHNQAAEILYRQIAKHVDPEKLVGVQVLNTVIGKMSGVITDSNIIKQMGLKTITPDLSRAILVEEFNRILISRIILANYKRAIEVFVEKNDLLPFEEAKLYGHNAIHALIGYLADLKGMYTISQAGHDKEIMAIARKAFIEESGATLIKRHRNVHDPLFTNEGYREDAEDLLERMINPYLNDLVSRVCRDHVRKLRYNDRLYGTMRLALQYNVEPIFLALGAAAAILSMIKHRDAFHEQIPYMPEDSSDLSDESLRRLLLNIWGEERDEYALELAKLTWIALEKIFSNFRIV
jgi:mannitol-1-phosphate/altronate dehydrogenase